MLTEGHTVSVVLLLLHLLQMLTFVDDFHASDDKLQNERHRKANPLRLLRYAFWHPCIQPIINHFQPSSFIMQVPDRRCDVNFAGLSFPGKMYTMLEDADEYGFTNTIGWEASGRDFRIRNPKVFTDLVLSKYHAQTKLKSLQRQLNIYG